MIGLFSARKFFRYAVMPEFFSRLNSLTMSGFQNVAYLMAVVYQMVRLLPNNHPYLDARNIGRFGIRHVIAEAANNLVISRKNIDQIILFGVMLLGMGMLVIQVLLLGASIFMYPASAVPPPPPANWNDFFVVANPRQDIAYIMLDLVFGVRDPASILPTGGDSFFHSCVGYVGPNIFDHCVDSWGVPIADPDFSNPNINATLNAGNVFAPTFGPLTTQSGTMFPFPIHWGLQYLFGMYNLGLLIVASMITAYFMATVVAETAQSGTPFGKRFNKLWAPLRIVMAIGLLMPGLGAQIGYSSSQYIVLYAAKYGSAFATNGWNRFNDTLTGSLLSSAANDPISKPTAPDLDSISLFMWLVNVCGYMNMQLSSPNIPVAAWVVGRQDRGFPNNALNIDAATTYDDVLNWLDPYPQMITIRFGDHDDKLYPKEDANVSPICGEIQIPLTDPRKLAEPIPRLPVALGPYNMQKFYFDLIKILWLEDGSVSLQVPINPYSAAEIADGGGGKRSRSFATKSIQNIYVAPDNAPLRVQYISSVNNTMKADIDVAINLAVAAQALDPSWLAGPCANGPGSTLRDKGWGAAGIWYNCLAELNGSMTSAVTAVPVPTLYPGAMESVAAIKSQYDERVTASQRFAPNAAGVNDIALQQNLGQAANHAMTLYAAEQSWVSGSMDTTRTRTTNPVASAISMFLGTNGLYDIRRNQTVHPLAQLVGIGRALVEAAVRKLGYALVGSIVARGLDGADGGLTGVASSMLVTVAMLGLSAGFVLFYIVPFLPFLYFYFALGGWVKGIFEAMIGAPLWALAHIRIDGNGLPGNAALNGYFLIFEIFVRPILTVFGLLASVTIFAALVSALNSIWDLVIYNVSGFDIEKEITGPAADSVIESMRGTIDEFFFTIIYAVIVYMMAMSSFKLIDQIPNNILRWMGQSVATFGDTREDPAQGLMGRASMGAQQSFSRLGSGMQGIVGAISSSK